MSQGMGFESVYVCVGGWWGVEGVCVCGGGDAGGEFTTSVLSAVAQNELYSHIHTDTLPQMCIKPNYFFFVLFIQQTGWVENWVFIPSQYDSEHKHSTELIHWFGLAAKKLIYNLIHDRFCMHKQLCVHFILSIVSYRIVMVAALKKITHTTPTENVYISHPPPPHPPLDSMYFLTVVM